MERGGGIMEAVGKNVEDLIEVGFWLRIKDKAICPSGKNLFSGKLLDHVTADIYDCDFRYWHTYLD